MKILVKLPKKSSKHKYSYININPNDLASQAKQLIISILGPTAPNLRLLTYISGIQVIMTESFPISFFKKEARFIIEVQYIGKSKNIFGRKAYRNSTYLDSLGLTKYFPTIKESIFDKAIYFCKKGYTSELEKLVDNYSLNNPHEEDLCAQSPPSMWTLIHYASYHGYPRIISYLVGRRVNCNKVTIDEWTPLQLSCYQGHADCVRELLMHPNLQIDKMTRFRGTGLHLACERSYVEIVKILLDANAYMTLEDYKGKIPIELSKNDEILAVLPVYMGKQELKKYSHEYPIPPPFCGEVYSSGTLFIHDRLEFLFMDIDKGVLNRYQKKENFLDKAEPDLSIRLADIQDVRMEQAPIFGGKNKYFFIVETSKSTSLYYTKYNDLRLEWIDRLKSGIRYSLLHHMNQPADVRRSMGQIPTEVAEDETKIAEENTEKEIINFKSFSILDEIGSGAFGIVYKVKKNNTEEIYAMKSLSKANLQKQKQLKYAISECKIMKELSHPFIVTLYYAFQTAHFLYLVLEFCSNGDLLTLVHARGRLDEYSAKFYLAEIILAIEYLHGLNIIYRDLKPANVLLDDEGHAKLSDFGLAKVSAQEENVVMTMAGTPAYLPPEIVTKKGVGKPSDIYGLGPTLFELLTGHPPYYSEDLDELFQNIRQAKVSFPSYISHNARDLINSVMNKDPSKRPQISQIKRHPFFRKLDWEALHAKRIKPPKLDEKTTEAINTSYDVDLD